MDLKKDNDHHWDFLEEIEAPMWVDLTIEAKSVHHNVEENWFLVSHQIHQSSASQIQASYKQNKQGRASLHVELEGPSSPKLPSSVSRSRGKDYKSKNWGVENRSYVSNNQYPIKRLGRETINGDLGSRQQAETKTNVGDLKFSRDCGSNSTRSTVTNTETIPCTGGLRRSLHPVTSKLGERKSGSIVTLMSSRQEQKSSAMSSDSSQTVSGTTELSLATRIALRKSCVSRQASRVEINDGRRVIGRKSSSGKSSVGSSSSLGFIIQNKELTKKEVAHGKPDIGSVVDNCQPAKTKVKSDVSRASTSQLSSRSSYCTKPKDAKTTTECAQQGAAKSKFICQAAKRKALLPRRDNEQDPATSYVKSGVKFQVSKINKCVAADKENMLPKRLGAGKRVTELAEPKKVATKGLGKASEVKGQSSRRVIHKAHFR